MAVNCQKTLLFWNVPLFKYLEKRKNCRAQIVFVKSTLSKEKFTKFLRPKNELYCGMDGGKISSFHIPQH